VHIYLQAGRHCKNVESLCSLFKITIICKSLIVRDLNKKSISLHLCFPTSPYPQILAWLFEEINTFSSSKCFSITLDLSRICCGLLLLTISGFFLSFHEMGYSAPYLQFCQYNNGLSSQVKI
jgi:hypothetical protein